MDFRKKQLYALYRCLEENRERLLGALVADGKTRAEADISDLSVVITELANVLANLDTWVKAERLSVGWRFAMAGDWAELVPVIIG